MYCFFQANRLRIAFISALVIGIGLRLTLRPTTALWEDEVIAATHAMQGFGFVIVDCLLNDIHPPLYFLQLHLWSLFGASDAWLIANSIVYSLIAIASLFIVEKRAGGAAQGLAAAAVLAVLPAAVWMGAELRMYAWLSVLLIWMLHFVRRTFAAPGHSRRDCLMIVILAFAIIYSHAIGFIAVLFFGLYAASFLATRRAALRDWMIGAAVFGFAGLMILPMMASDLLHPADMPPPHGIASMIEWAASTITGAGAASDVALRLAGALAYAIFCLAGTLYRPTRRMTLCFVVAPMALCIATSLAIRPLFKTNFFSTFLSPFIAIITAQLLLAIAQPKSRAAPNVFVLCGLATMAIIDRRDLPPSAYYREAAQTIEGAARPGDTLWVAQNDIFWGMARYMDGPHWGSPLDIRPPLREGSHWPRLFAMLGPDLVARLHMMPSGQSITTQTGLPIILANNSNATIEASSRVWLVTYSPRDDLAPDLPGPTVGALHLVQTITYPPLTVSLYEK